MFVMIKVLLVFQFYQELREVLPPIQYEVAADAGADSEGGLEGPASELTKIYAVEPVGVD